MSTVKISELPVLSSADAADEFVVVDDSAGVTKKITFDSLATDVRSESEPLTATTITASGDVSADTATIAGDVSADTATIAGDITSNGETVYHRGNVVGTVSESGGDVMGAVIERGENGNGEYVKFADGTMICYREIGTFHGNGTITGGVYVSNKISTDYPVDFVGSVVGSAGSADNGNNGFWVTARALNNDEGWESQAYRVNTFSTGDVGTIELTAIGRWY